MILGYISAHMNPAVVLALLILGRLNGTEFVAAIGGEFLGAFVGAVLVWLHYLPHFKTVPTPYSADADNLLLRGDTVSPTALGIGSYNVRAKDIDARRRGLGDIAHTFEDIKYYFQDSHYFNDPVDKHATLVEVALGPDEAKEGKGTVKARGLRRHSVQVCDVHKRLKDIDIQNFKDMLIGPQMSQSPSMMGSSSTDMRTSAASLSNGSAGAGVGAISNNDLSWNSSAGDFASAPTSANVHKSRDSSGQQQKEQFDSRAGSSIAANGHSPSDPSDPIIEKRRQQLESLYDAAVIADQNVKLAIFATRPAIYSPPFNFLVEFMSTTALVFGALMIFAREELLNEPERSLFNSLEGIWIGFFIFLLILGLGGPTGIAANPARDFAPRVAHALLPIPGKGKSEFYYSWIPFLAPLVGGCAGAGLFHVTQLLNNSRVSSD